MRTTSPRKRCDIVMIAQNTNLSAMRVRNSALPFAPQENSFYDFAGLHWQVCTVFIMKCMD